MLRRTITRRYPVKTIFARFSNRSNEKPPTFSEEFAKTFIAGFGVFTSVIGICYIVDSIKD